MGYRNYFTKEELAEMKRDFDEWEKERFGPATIEVYGVKKPEKPKKKGRTGVPLYKNIYEEFLNAYIDDAVEYFLEERQRRPKQEIDGRYFYKQSELETFINRYKEKGGDINKLHIGLVYYTKKDVDILGYEVSTKKYWQKHKEEYYARE